MARGRATEDAVEAVGTAGTPEAGGVAELERLRQALAEAHQRERATADVLRLLSAAPRDVQAVLDAIAEGAAKACDATDAILYRFMDDGTSARRLAHYGPTTPAGATGVIGGLRPVHTSFSRAVFEQQETVLIPDLATCQDDAEWRGQYALGFRTFLGVRVVHEGAVIGVILVRTMVVREFSAAQVAQLRTFASQMGIAIEHARLFSELQERLAEQTATADVLRVIASAPTDLARVLEATIYPRQIMPASCLASSASLRPRRTGLATQRLSKHRPLKP